MRSERENAYPGGIQAFPTARAAEGGRPGSRKHRALAVGDVLLGADAKPGATADRLRLCPERWLGVRTHADLRRHAPAPARAPVERVLVSHGAPVLADGSGALAALLGHCLIAD